MKRLIALVAVLGVFAVAPVFAQQVETLPSGKKIKIVEKDDGTVIILPAEEDSEKKVEKKSIEKDSEDAELEDGLDGDIPQEVKDLLKRVREKVERDAEEGDDTPRVKIIPWGEGEDAPRVKIIPWGEDNDMPNEMREAMKEMREQMEKFRKEAEERFEKMRKEMEEKMGKEGAGKIEDDPDAEVEEYTKEAPDGSWKVHVKIIHKTSKSHSESHSESAPEAPKKESKTERKQ
ncbi:MAG: hypothetical protein KDB82_16285 [Planctomycetes bacterium]|nr:hypothetical protein [Planctomycetota bacterium]